MKRDSKLEKAIRGIDWDFRGAMSNHGLHRLHWYPGTFIPQIPAYLIELLTVEGDAVYDPFCGVGTTLLEAIRLGRTAVGTDINKIALMVANAKLTFLSSKTLKERTSRFQQDVANHCDLAGIGDACSLFAKHSKDHGSIINPEYSAIEPWYHPDTFREMLVLREFIGKESGKFRRLLEVGFSHIAKGCSSQRHHWGYVADNMVPKEFVYIDAVSAFNRALDDCVIAYEQFLGTPALRSSSIGDLNSRSSVIEANLLDGPAIDNESIDLVVTSPPYPSVTDYTRAMRLSLAWLGELVDQLREHEVGARYKRGRKNALNSYFQEMEICIINIAKSLRSNGHLCVVVGESAKQRNEWDVVNTLQRIILDAGFIMPVDRIRRTRSRERIRRRDGVANDEFILIFQKCH